REESEQHIAELAKTRAEYSAVLERAPEGAKWPCYNEKCKVHALCDFLARRFGTVLAGWRAMDARGKGSLSFSEFCRSCRLMRFDAPLQVTWQKMDTKRRGVVTFEEIWPEIAQQTKKLQDALVTDCGSLVKGWQRCFDPRCRGYVTLEDFVENLKKVQKKHKIEDPRKLFSMFAGCSSKKMTLAEFNWDGWMDSWYGKEYGKDTWVRMSGRFSRHLLLQVQLLSSRAGVALNEALTAERAQAKASRFRGQLLLRDTTEDGVVTDASRVVTETLPQLGAFSFVAGGFFQNNSAILPAFLQHVVNEASVDKPEVLVDLYCGVGLFAVASSRLKRFERIFGVEVDAAAIDLARRNGPSCTFLAADAARGLRRVAAELRPDQDVVVVVDPPRQGLRPEARAAVLRLKPKRLVYVSCDCATQARDLKDFVAAGYVVKKAKAFSPIAVPTVFPMGRSHKKYNSLARPNFPGTASPPVFRDAGLAMARLFALLLALSLLGLLRLWSQSFDESNEPPGSFASTQSPVDALASASITVRTAEVSQPPPSGEEFNTTLADFNSTSTTEFFKLQNLPLEVNRSAVQSCEEDGWNFSCLVFVGGAEGYTNQLLSTLDAYRLLLRSKRRLLVLAPMRSEHAWPVHNVPQCLDDVLELPNAVCQQPTHLTPEDDRDQLVRSKQCRFDGRETNPLRHTGQMGDWYVFWRLLNASSWDYLPKVAFSEYSNSSNCIFSRSWRMESWKLWPSTLRIQPRYVQVFEEMRRRLFGSQRYLGVHWRRGDQLLTKCKLKMDKSVNCGQVEDLQRLVQRKLQGRKMPVYVATNEKDQETLAELRRVGFRLQSDAGFELDSLESFFADVYLVGCSYQAVIPGFNFGSGTSSVHKLIHTFRLHFQTHRADGVCGDLPLIVDHVNCGRLLEESCDQCKVDCMADCQRLGESTPRPKAQTATRAWDGTCQTRKAKVSLKQRLLNSSAGAQRPGLGWPGATWLALLDLSVSKKMILSGQFLVQDLELELWTKKIRGKIWLVRVGFGVREVLGTRLKTWAEDQYGTAPSEAELKAKMTAMKKAETKEGSGLDPAMLQALEKLFTDCGGNADEIAKKSGLSDALIKEKKPADAKEFATLAGQGLLSAD
ncbi:unnamed protein product, partial [Effrenium voratum]